MKKVLLSFSLIMGTILMANAQTEVKRVILLTIDGLHWEAPGRLSMPVFKSLIKEGTYIQQSYVIIPHHPTIGDYSKFNSCSFPNPVLHEGTIFLNLIIRRSGTTVNLIVVLFQIRYYMKGPSF